MAMNGLELKFMNSPFNQLWLKNFKFRTVKTILASQNLNLTGKVILEAGCGNGYGLELITKAFRPTDLVAFDIDPKQIRLAMQRQISASLYVGSVTNIKLPPEKFDVAFAFTLLHHVKHWRKALKELNRVLKPRGLLMVNDFNRKMVGRLERYLRVDHPDNDLFSWKELQDGLISAGFRILRVHRTLDAIGFFLCVKI